MVLTRRSPPAVPCPSVRVLYMSIFLEICVYFIYIYIYMYIYIYIYMVLTRRSPPAVPCPSARVLYMSKNLCYICQYFLFLEICVYFGRENMCTRRENTTHSYGTYHTNPARTAIRTQIQCVIYVYISGNRMCVSEETIRLIYTGRALQTRAATHTPTRTAIRTL